MKREYSYIANKVHDIISNIIMSDGVVGFDFFDFAKFYFERHKGKESISGDEQLLDVIDDMMTKNPIKHSHLKPLGVADEKNLTLKELEKTNMKSTKSFYVCEKMDNRKVIERFISKNGEVSEKEFVYRLVDETGLFTDEINVQKQYFILKKHGGRVQLRFSDIPSDKTLKYVDSSVCMNYKDYIEK